VARIGQAAFIVLSAMAGFGLYRAVREGLWWVLAVAIVAAACMALAPQLIAKAVVKRQPSAAVWIVQSSLLGIVVLGGGIAVGVAALGALVEGVVKGNSDVDKAVAQTIGGAVGVVGSLLVLDDLQKGSGAFWPSSRTRALLRASFAATFPTGGTAGYDALWEDRLQANLDSKTYDVTGWGLNARLVRAKVIKASL